MNILEAEYREAIRESRKIHIPYNTVKNVAKLIVFVIAAVIVRIITLMD